MAGKLGTLTLDLIAKIGGFTGPLDKANKHAKKTSVDIAKYGKAIGIGFAVGATAAATAVALMVNKQRDLIDQQAKMAQRLNTTYTSLSNLARAGELAGISLQQVETAGRMLDINIGKALQNEKLQAEAFDRIKLSAEEISKLPLDQKIATINKALADNVRSSERAAVAMDIFGAKNASALQMLDSGTIAEAARQVEIFGLNLSDVDAAKVEMANDAMSTFHLLADGIGKQLTVILAPALREVGNMFLEAAEDAGGLGNVVSDSVDKAVNALAVVIDAGDIIKRSFKVAADSIILVISAAQHKTLSWIASILDAIDKIPKIDITINTDDLRASAKEAESIATLAAANIEKTITPSLAGTRFVESWQKIQDSAQKAAEETIKGRDAAKSTGDAFSEVAESANGAKDKTVELGKAISDAFEDIDKANRRAWDVYNDYAGLVRELRTDEEKLTDTLRERLAIVDNISTISNADRKKTIGRIVDSGFMEPPKFAGLAPEIGGPFGELNKIDEAQKELEDWYSKSQEMLAEYRAGNAELNEEWNKKELEIKQKHEAELLKIEQSRQVAQVAGASAIFGELAGIAKGYYGEQSGIYRRLFIMEKSAALASTLMASSAAIAKAWASAPFPANLPAVALTTVKTGALQAVIGSIALTGQAHDGIDKVPQDGTWWLQKGERVTTAETSAKLDRMLNDIRMGGVSGGRGAINQTINVVGMVDKRTSAQIARDTSRKQMMVNSRLGT